MILAPYPAPPFRNLTPAPPPFSGDEFNAGGFESGALRSSFGGFDSHVSPAAFGLTCSISRNLKR